MILSLFQLEQIGLDSAWVQIRSESGSPIEAARVRSTEGSLVWVLVYVRPRAEVLWCLWLEETRGMLDGISRFLSQDRNVIWTIVCATRCRIWPITHSGNGPLWKHVIWTLRWSCSLCSWCFPWCCICFVRRGATWVMLIGNGVTWSRPNLVHWEELVCFELL